MTSPNHPVDPRTLVVDDDPTMLEVIATVLRDAGLTSVETAADGEAALERLVADRVELLVCDLNMPAMDGVRLLGLIAAAAVRPAIILLSGEDSRVLDASRQFAEAKNLAVLGALRKPVSPDSLLELLQLYRPVSGQRLQGASRPVSLDGNSLRRGLQATTWHLAYQPKVDLRDGTLYGVEGLLRWQDPDTGPVPPPDVIQVAEDAGLIDTLTLAILARAVQDRAALVRRGFDVGIAINLSMHNLVGGAIVDRMSEIVAAAGDQPSRYTLEVTETHLVKDLSQVLEPLIRARLQGFLISIDDYGTGAASMQFLTQLPSTELKIDRSFVVAGPLSDQGCAVLHSAIDLGLRLRQDVVAEGIDSEEQARLVLDLGCHLGQGYLFGKPMPLEDLVAWMSARPGRRPSAMTGEGV